MAAPAEGAMTTLLWCSDCKQEVEPDHNESDGFTCCTLCGKVLDDAIFSNDATFTKGVGGASQLDGNFVPESGVARSVGPRGARAFGYPADSQEKTVNKGKHEIGTIADRLNIRPREDVIAASVRVYKLAVARNFTRGRRMSHVAGACLYLVCRQENRPYMLIDVSDALQTNMYALGAVFLQLISLLRLETQPNLARPVDPSLYIHRFADKLQLGAASTAVAQTALRLVASMKRDWLQTGRRPAGICGAALIVAAAAHGCPRRKEEVVAVVHVGESTLNKRLAELGSTDAAQLTAGELHSEALRLERAPMQGAAEGEEGALTCIHAAAPGTRAVRHGMCALCLAEYLRVSGGAAGGCDPPAYARAEKARARSAAQRRQEALEFQAEQEAGGAEGEGSLLLEVDGLLDDPALRYAMRNGGAPPPPREDQTPEAAEAEPADAAPAAPAAAAAPAPAPTPAAAAAAAPAAADTAAAAAEPAPAAPPAAAAAPRVGERRSAEAAGLAAGGREEEAPAPPRAPPPLEARAIAALRELVGAVAAASCLPLQRDGSFSGRVALAQLQAGPPEAAPGASRHGAHVRRVPRDCLAFLLVAGAFDGQAILYLRRQAGHDVLARMPQRVQMLAAEAEAEAAAAAAAATAEAAAEAAAEAGAGTGAGAGAAEAGAGAAAAGREAGGGEGLQLALVAGGGGVVAAVAEEGGLSDIDDSEVAPYLHTAEEAELKAVVWGEMHRDFLLAREAREAAQREMAQREAAKEAAAAREAAEEGGGAAAGAMAPPASKPKAARRRAAKAGGRGAGAGGEAEGEPDTAEEATRAMLARKKLSSKINYEALSSLFDHAPAPAARGAPPPLPPAGPEAAPGALAPQAPAFRGAAAVGSYGAAAAGRRTPASTAQAGGLGSIRPSGALGGPASALLGGPLGGRVALPALPSGSLGHGLSGLRAPGRLGGMAAATGGAAPTASGATDAGVGLLRRGVSLGGTSRPRPADQAE